jgi:isopentenyl-diphosphate delta-isomerase
MPSPASPPDPEPLVELVDQAGRARGRSPKLAAHHPPGRRHRAISAFLLDAGGRLLLQRRAAGKYHSPGRWSNTCCGHPLPGEPPADAAARRVAAELGIAASGLRPAGTVAYRLTDPVSGLVEHEWNHLFVGRAPGDPDPDPREVADWAWLPLTDLEAAQAHMPFTVWFPVVLGPALPALRGLS